MFNPKKTVTSDYLTCTEHAKLNKVSATSLTVSELKSDTTDLLKQVLATVSAQKVLNDTTNSGDDSSVQLASLINALAALA